MATNTSGVDLANYQGLLAAGAFTNHGARVDDLTLTWDYYPGAPHSLPACDVRRPAAADAGVYDGIPCEGYYAGSHSAKATQDLASLYRVDPLLAAGWGNRWCVSPAVPMGQPRSGRVDDIIIMLSLHGSPLTRR